MFQLRHANQCDGSDEGVVADIEPASRGRPQVQQCVGDDSESNSSSHHESKQEEASDTPAKGKVEVVENPGRKEADQQDDEYVHTTNRAWKPQHLSVTHLQRLHTHTPLTSSNPSIVHKASNHNSRKNAHL